MSKLCSPVKFGPLIKKKARQSLNWQNCVICQELGTNEDLINMQSQGKHSFLRAMETRKDDVYSKVLKELTSLSDIKLDSTVVKFHKPCCYTSKQNLKPFLQSEVLDDSDQGSSSLTSSIIKTVPSEPSVFRRSDWSSCIFCKLKTHKNYHKLHKVETAERALTV